MSLPTPAALAAPAATALLCLTATTALQASSLEHIRQLENLINASGTETVVSNDCPPQHAGYYEHDGGGISRLVICRRHVDLGDVKAVWGVMAHEATHLMQSCTGGTALGEQTMPRTLRELQLQAPHYARLISTAYEKADQRLEAEAFWMELQPADAVIALFRRTCAGALEAGGLTGRPTPTGPRTTP